MCCISRAPWWRSKKAFDFLDMKSSISKRSFNHLRDLGLLTSPWWPCPRVPQSSSQSAANATSCRLLWQNRRGRSSAADPRSS
uniref:Uncharacterized protein n=1 Tax=Arundo donax TaxID=35708 RepID=A0A0A9GPY3_ARUDO